MLVKSSNDSSSSIVPNQTWAVLCGGLLGLALVAILIAQVQYVSWVSLDRLCRDKAYAPAARLASAYSNWPLATAVDRACSGYFQGYLIGLAGDPASTGRAYEQTSDQILDGGQFAQCMAHLSNRASFFEYVLSLPHLAETCQRCAVAECRRHNDEAKEMFKNSAGYPGIGRAALLRQSYLLLAEQTVNLAALFCQHQKFEIADRAYQDAIASAAFAANLREGGGSNGGARNTSHLQRYYLAYVAFLYSRQREDDALAALDSMNQICGY